MKIRFKKIRKVTTTYLPRHLGHTGVGPEYLRDERVEVRKGVHELAVFLFAERTAKFSTKGFLDVLVAGEFDKRPLCVTSDETSKLEGRKGMEDGRPTVKAARERNKGCLTTHWNDT